MFFNFFCFNQLLVDAFDNGGAEANRGGRNGAAKQSDSRRDILPERRAPEAANNQRVHE